MSQYDIAAYIWPAYTGDEPRTRIFWPDGMGEWQTVKAAGAKFEGHQWPRKPLWGYVNEADPYVMEMQIEAAVDHGVNVFIYDWYWYDNRPFLENCLNDGFLKAKNNDKMKFYIMWANHNANYLWDKRNSHIDGCTVWNGAVDKNQFRVIGRRWIDKYFTHPSYYKIDGKPVVSIFELDNFINGLGGIDETKKQIDWLREEAVKSGLKGVHFQCVLRRNGIVGITGVDGKSDFDESDVISQLGFDSATHYQFVNYADVNRKYCDVAVDVLKRWDEIKDTYKVMYYPHVSVGWDNNPRYKELRDYIMKENTPEEFEKMLVKAKDFADKNCNTPLITINSWNEWTESSYLQPDDLYGYGYLEAIKRVFKK